MVGNAALEQLSWATPVRPFARSPETRLREVKSASRTSVFGVQPIPGHETKTSTSSAADLKRARCVLGSVSVTFQCLNQ